MDKMRKDLKRNSWTITIVVIGLVVALVILVNIIF
jgi:hypothetical protein